MTAHRPATATRKVAQASAAPGPSAGDENRSKKLLLPRLLASLVSLTLVGLGLAALWTQHYYGRTTKLGGAEVSIDGAPAVAMGLATVFLGLMPLALWFSRPRPAVAWSVAWAVAAAASFCVGIYGTAP